jgi:hypothetical protein
MIPGQKRKGGKGEKIGRNNTDINTCTRINRMARGNFVKK